MQQHALAFPGGGRRYAPAIPDPRMERRVADAALLRLERERHDDFFRKGLLAIGPVLSEPGVGVVKGKIPLAIQRLPIGARKLRLGNLGARRLRHQRGRESQQGYRFHASTFPAITIVTGTPPTLRISSQS